MSQDLESLVRRADLLALDDQLEELFGDDLSPRLLRLVTDKKEGRMPDTTPSPEKSRGTKLKSSTGDRQVEDRPTCPRRSSRPEGQRRWMPALAAAVAVVTVGVGAFIFLGGDEPPPAADAEAIMNQAVELAEQYVEALNSYDASRARALVAEDVQINSPVFMDLEELADVDKLEAAVQHLEIVGFQYSPFQCDLSFRPADARADTFLWVLCDYEMDSRPQQIVGYPPIAGSFGFGVVGGVITRIDDRFPWAEFGPNVDEPFTTWLNANHPDGLDSVFVATTGVQYPRLTPEALDLLAIYLDEYEASVTGG